MKTEENFNVRLLLEEDEERLASYAVVKKCIDRYHREYMETVLPMVELEVLLESYGFDTYCGVLHKQFYMRKSLVCDIVEPFRVLIDDAVKKAINLKQIKEEDFIVIQNQYRLKWEHSPNMLAF